MLIRRFCVPVSLFLLAAVLDAVPLIAQEPASKNHPARDQNADPLRSEQAQARDALNQGVEAFKNGQYDEAVLLFENAKQLDPHLLTARLYLATTYAAQYIPGAPSEQNQRLGRSAVEEFKALLQIDPQNLSAIDGLGSITFQMSGTPFNQDGFLESKSYHQKHIEIRPADPEPYYWIGVIDWTLSFQGNIELRQSLQLDAMGPGGAEPLPPGLRTEYDREFGPMIEEGVKSLKHAIELRPDYDDAMAYLNLMYRRQADTVESMEERDRLTKMADDLLDKIKEIKQKRAEASSQPQ